MSILDEKQILLIYEVQHSHILQVEASDSASVFPLVVDTAYHRIFHQVLKRVFTKHPQYQRLEFTGQNYTTVAEYLMWYYLEPP